MVRNCMVMMLLLFLLSLSMAEARAIAVPADTAYFKNKRKSVKIPFKLVHNLIVIPLRINDSKDLHFILDSGVKNTLITKLFYSDSLSLNETDKIVIRGLGVGHTIDAIHSKGNTLHLPGILGVEQELFVLLEDIFNLSTRMGMPIHGIIGYDIFKNFVVDINYSRKIITLYRPDIEVKIKKDAQIYPLLIEGNKAYIYADVKQHNGETVKVKLVVDTGASHSVSLYLPTNNRLELPPKVMEAYLGRGLSGDINGKIGRISSVMIGKYELLDLPASYPDPESIKAALELANRNGNLGSDILKRFHVTFDYPRQRLIMKPNSHFKTPFHYNLAGFEVSTPLPGTNFYMVSYVVDNSPAMTAGLKSGDMLININGKECINLNLNDVLDEIEGRPGQKLRVKLKRDDKYLNVDLLLQSRI